MSPDLASIRTEYELGGLSEHEAGDDPMALFARWFEQARQGGVHEPNAMVLGTLGPSGPTTRTVLLKGLDDQGFVCFTNQTSRKGRELAADPRCCLLFPWFQIQRQVRIEGTAAPLPRAQSEAYFATRPRASQIGAWASTQSQVVDGREDLEQAYARYDAQYPDQVPCPPYWGGYLVEPDDLEFWQGRRGRMHDRLLFRRRPHGWVRERLAP